MLQTSFRQQALIIALCVVVHLGLVSWLVAASFSNASPVVPARPVMVRLIVPPPPTPTINASEGGAAASANAVNSAAAPAPQTVATAAPAPVALPAPKAQPKAQAKIAPQPKLSTPPVRKAASPTLPVTKAAKAVQVTKAVPQRSARAPAASGGTVAGNVAGEGSSTVATGGSATSGAMLGAMNAGSGGSGGTGLHGIGSAAGDGAAVPTHQPKPTYPAFARRLGHEGKVLVRIRVLSSGEVADASVATSSGFSALDEAALAAVKRWRFRPAQRAGRAVDTVLQVPITFKLETS